MNKILILSILSLGIMLSSCAVKQPNDTRPIVTDPIVNEPNVPISCIDKNDPFITSISTNSGTIDTKIKLEGCNLSGFEGDKHVWIENKEGIKGLLYGEKGSSSEIIHISLKSPLCQFDTSYSGLKCDSFLKLVPGKYKIYVMPWGKVSNKVDVTIIAPKMTSDISYQDIIDYLNKNITEIITSYSKILPSNGKWFADGFGFTSINNIYVDYEDGHYLYRALLECNIQNNTITCLPQAIFEKQKSGWIVIQGEDTQKNNDIIYKQAADYEWER